MLNPRTKLAVQMFTPKPNMKFISSHSAKPRGANRESSSTTSKTDWCYFVAVDRSVPVAEFCESRA
jgi:hypothetical protein